MKDPAATTSGTGGGSLLARAANLVRRTPWTSSVVVLMLVLAVATGALWDDLDAGVWWDRVAYGLPALEDGRWWTPVTGSLFAEVPAQYLPVIIGFALMVGFCELRMGTRTAIVLSVVGQLVAVVGAAALLAVLKGTDWAWAVDLAKDLDVGFSAGSICALTVTAFTLRAPWRGRILFVVVSYCVLNLLFLGVIWDIEHFIALSLGLVLGLRLQGPQDRGIRRQLTRHEWRLFATGVLVFVSLAQLMALSYPKNGPLGELDHPPHTTLLVALVIVQVVVALGLRRGSNLAWRIALAIAVLGIIASFFIGPWPRSLASLFLYGVVLVVLVQGRRSYTAEVSPAAVNRLVRDGLIIVAAFAAYVVIGFTAINRWSTSPVTWRMKVEELFERLTFSTRGEFEGDDRAARAFLDSLSLIPLLIVVTFLVVLLLRVRRPRKGVDRDRALALLKEYGGTNLSWMSTWPDNAHFITADARATVAYQVHSGTAIALGDPTGAREARAGAVREFVRFCDAQGYLPCLFSSSPAVLDEVEALGWQAIQVAEDTVIDLPTLEFKGKSWQDIRTAINRAAKQGIVFRMVRLQDESFGTVQQVRGISDQWVSDKGLPEMGFTLGGVDEALDPEVRVGLAVDGDGVVQGVTSWLPVYGPGGTVTGWTLDVMRRLPDGFRPVVEFMIASACLTFKEQGALTVSLSGAPLARSDSDGTDELRAIDALLDSFGRIMEPMYGFRSLHQFKTKFKPRYEPMYLCYPDDAALPRIGIALTRAYLPDAKLTDFATMLLPSHS